jgi:hypothetical protein
LDFDAGAAAALGVVPPPARVGLERRSERAERKKLDRKLVLGAEDLALDRNRSARPCNRSMRVVGELDLDRAYVNRRSGQPIGAEQRLAIPIRLKRATKQIGIGIGAARRKPRCASIVLVEIAGEIDDAARRFDEETAAALVGIPLPAILGFSDSVNRLKKQNAKYRRAA